MSEFDKEAERERLREKYERDREDREVAQKMSDLLLKGATMTNAHCGECGSPIFRQNGREFCPVCGAEVVDRGDAEAAEDAGAAAGAVDEATDADQATDVDEARTGSTAEPDGDAPAADGPDPEPTTTNGSPDAGTAGTPAPSTPARDRQAAPATGDVPTPADATGSTGGQPASEAVTALQRALVRHARAAETDDPRVARDHLEAAREAAEALAALRRQG